MSTEESQIKRKLITNWPKFTWRSRATQFIIVFGTVWLFLEPASGFGLGEGLWSKVGLWGYLGLFFISSVSVVVYEFWQRGSLKGQLDLINITIQIPEDGTIHTLQTPRNIQVGIFVDRFVDSLNYAPPESMFENRHMYDIGFRTSSNKVFTRESTFAQQLDEFEGADRELRELNGHLFGTIRQELLESQTRETSNHLDVTDNKQALQARQLVKERFTRKLPNAEVKENPYGKFPDFILTFANGSKSAHIVKWYGQVWVNIIPDVQVLGSKAIEGIKRDEYEVANIMIVLDDLSDAERLIEELQGRFTQMIPKVVTTIGYIIEGEDGTDEFCPHVSLGGLANW